jgi:hypothetical protein
MGRNVITVLAVLVIVIGVMQKTSIVFLAPDTQDFVWGLAAGLSFGAIVSWIVTPRDRKDA